MSSLHPVSLLKKFLSPGAKPSVIDKVTVGDRFELDAPSVSFWIVERISDVRMSSSPLVSLSREGHPEITKTVSLSAFEHDGDYRIVLQ
ncbi:MAG: hypothetical protein COB37_03020 [Kordiimonadales bacterium]|nr:MAG: hypothetical protein COB37_03020 [Kordiimonadales bacterium]